MTVRARRVIFLTFLGILAVAIASGFLFFITGLAG